MNMTETLRPRIILADHHRLCAEGIRCILQRYFDVVDLVTNGPALIDSAMRWQPDIVIAETSLPLLNGIEVPRRLSKNGIFAKVIMLSDNADAGYVSAALRAGAIGYVRKTAAASELIAAVYAAVKNRTYISTRLREMMTEPVTGLDRQTHTPNHLTSRQREVLQLIAEGRSSKEIATILQISTKTVEFHRSNIIGVLDIHSVAELTRYAIQQGMVSVS